MTEPTKTLLTYPTTLQGWWEFIQTESPYLKVRYFLRNQWGMGQDAGKMIEFLTTEAERLGIKITCHRLWQNTAYPLAGNYSIDAEGRCIQFRLDCIKPLPSGPRNEYNFVVCNDFPIESEPATTGV